MADKKADKKEEKESTEGEAQAKPKSKKKLLMIIIPVVLLLVGGVAAFFLMGGKEAPKEGDAAHEEAEAKPKKLSTIKLDPFIVNLSENISFLKVTLLLEIDPEVFSKAAKAEGEEGQAHGGGGSGGGDKEAEGGGHPALMKEREPMIRDAIIRVLSSKTTAEVLSSDGKAKLKDELLEAINEAIGLPENPVVNIYFVEFIIQ